MLQNCQYGALALRSMWNIRCFNRFIFLIFDAKIGAKRADTSEKYQQCVVYNFSNFIPLTQKNNISGMTFDSALDFAEKHLNFFSYCRSH